VDIARIEVLNARPRDRLESRRTRACNTAISLGPLPTIADPSSPRSRRPAGGPQEHYLLALFGGPTGFKFQFTYLTIAQICPTRPRPRAAAK
jgi:hypothetical protein